MKDKINHLIRVGVFCGIIIFIIRCMVKPPELKIYDVFGVISEAVTCTSVIIFLYNRFIWKLNPFSKTPKIYGKYNGTVYYSLNGEKLSKDMDVIIKQTFCSTYVTITTDEITSTTLVNDIKVESDQQYLYYTYITDPTAEFSENNPIKRGTCRMRIIDRNNLKGVYWTSGKTTGDIEFIRIK